MSDTTDDMEFYSGMIPDEYDDIDNVFKKLKIAIWALKKINRIELNNQRPGGDYSESAKISYYALNKIEGL